MQITTVFVTVDVDIPVMMSEVFTFWGEREKLSQRIQS